MTAAGGPRPKDDLIYRIEEDAAATRNAGWDGDAQTLEQAAARLREQEERIRELHDNGQRLLEAADSWKEEAQRNQRLVAELEANHLWQLQRAERAEIHIKELEAEIERLRAENAFLHKRRGEVVIDRDRYRAALGKLPEGRDVMLAAMLAELAKWQELHRVIAEELGADKETWPDHRNAPLAIGATFMLHKQRAERAEAERDALRADADKCKCVYATSRNSEAVRKGFEMGGYLMHECNACYAARKEKP